MSLVSNVRNNHVDPVERKKYIESQNALQQAAKIDRQYIASCLESDSASLKFKKISKTLGILTGIVFAIGIIAALYIIFAPVTLPMTVLVPLGLFISSLVLGLGISSIAAKAVSLIKASNKSDIENSEYSADKISREVWVWIKPLNVAIEDLKILRPTDIIRIMDERIAVWDTYLAESDPVKGFKIVTKAQ